MRPKCVDSGRRGWIWLSEGIAMVGIRTGRAWLGLSGVFAVACGPLVEEQPQYHPLVCGQEAPVQVLATADPLDRKSVV